MARRTLTESSTVDGTLGYGATLELYDRLAGTFTWLPAVGATIARGGTLFRVNNLPVVLMYGTVPAYRTLKEGVSDGPDVAQLNRNLIDLGYDPDGAITDVEALQRSDRGRGAPLAEGRGPTGNRQGGTRPGRVRARRPARHRRARRARTGPARERESAAGRQPANEPATPESSPGSNEATEPPAAHKTARRKHRQAAKASRPKKPASDKRRARTRRQPANDASKPAAERRRRILQRTTQRQPEGAAAPAPARLVLTTTSTQQLVQLKLKAEQQQLAHVGERRR